MNTKYVKVPSLVYVVVLMTIIAGFVPGKLIGFNTSGLGWFIPLAYSSLILSRRMKYVTMPFGLWLPWFVLLLIYLLILDWNALDFRVSPIQRTFQLLVPIIVGMAISTFELTQEKLEKIVQLLRKCGYLIFFIVLIGSMNAILSSQATGLAAQVMTAMLISIFFTARFVSFKEKRDIIIVILMSLIPVFAITRTVTMVTLASVFLTFARVPLKKRLLFMFAAVALVLFVFNLPQFQAKFFFSGQGTLNDISMDNPDFATSGRGNIWDIVFYEAMKNPWFGHGTGFGETITYSISPVGYPHNDWLLTFADYGVVGVIIYLVCNVLMLYTCLKGAKQATAPMTKLFLISGASTFIPFMAVMYTDNIMVYSSFFGILQYTIIGAGFAALRQDKMTKKKVYSRNKHRSNVQFS